MLHEQELLENRVENLKDLVRKLRSTKSPRKCYEKVTARIHAMPIISEEEELPVDVSTIVLKETEEEESDQFQSEKVNIMSNIVICNSFLLFYVQQ